MRDKRALAPFLCSSTPTPTWKLKDFLTPSTTSSMTHSPSQLSHFIGNFAVPKGCQRAAASVFPLPRQGEHNGDTHWLD